MTETKQGIGADAEADLCSKIVEVKHGESWDDYRPARPEHFIGRKDAQQKLLRFLDTARTGQSTTRVFAITGDTGMGKSSLVAKLRSRTRTTRLKSRVFLYAVDVRAATGPSYVLGSLVNCLRMSAQQGFGAGDSADLVISNHSDPLNSESIQQYLATVEGQRQVICLVFDQFEELYSKPELFPIFEQAQRLFLSAAASAFPFVVGFVLRSDSTVQQDHPAYYLWHRLADHRYEVRLRVFSYTEVCAALTLFEKELGQRLRPELRRQIIENCEGYPWLLKKLCIHLYEQICAGVEQAALDETLDVQSLFARDLNGCTTAERACLQMIAKQSPADWYEILAVCGADVARSLQDKRLIIRSGDRLNLYWDIFREYVLTGKVPAIPFTYLCSSPSVGAFLSAAIRLSKDVPVGIEKLSAASGLSVKTVYNVVHDLIMFGVASGSPAAVVLDSRMVSAGEQNVLDRLRVVMKRHALVRQLSLLDEGSAITIEDMITALREINPAANHRQKTWEMYAERLGPWLVAAGLLEVCPSGWVLRDQGKVCIPSKRGSRFRLGCFLGDAPPLRVVKALVWLSGCQPQDADAIRHRKFRNASRVLDRLDLTSRDEEGRYITVYDVPDENAATELVWRAATNDETLVMVWDYLASRPRSTGSDIGRLVSGNEGQQWTEASLMRTGNALRQWAAWIGAEPKSGTVPRAPGPRVAREGREKESSDLFGEWKPSE